MKDDLNIDLLKRCARPRRAGPRGVSALIEDEVQGLFDETYTDAMGSLICTRHPRPKGDSGSKKTSKKKAAPAKGEARRVMLLSHMDEIGFYVSHIDDKGFIRVNPAGGFDTRNLFSRRVLVCTSGETSRPS